MPLSGIGFGEMLVIAMLVLIVFGPQRLPEITRSVGKAMREFKRGMNEIQRELEVADREQRWGTAASPPSAASSAATHPAAAAAASAATSAAATADGASETEAGDGDAAGSTDPEGAAEPVIAPPTFGSDLPEEIEAQLGPPASQTGVVSRPPEPAAGPGPSTEDGSAAEDGPTIGEGRATEDGPAADAPRDRTATGTERGETEEVELPED